MRSDLLQRVQAPKGDSLSSSTQTVVIASASSVYERQRPKYGSLMKKSKRKKATWGMRAECDFSKGKRGEYARRFASGTNLVALDPDVAQVFPDTESVNETLRFLIELGKRQGNGARAKR